MWLSQDQQANRTLTLNRFVRSFHKLTVVATVMWLPDDSRKTGWWLFLLVAFTSFVSTTVRAGGTYSCCHSSFK